MRKQFIIFSALLLLTFAFCTKEKTESEFFPPVPEGAQAISLLGEPLFPASPDETQLAKYEEAKKIYLDNPRSAANLIWYGRRAAYKGDYREAIKLYSIGIAEFREDARFYRHRGHRYISIREIDRAIKDFEKAAELIEGKDDEIEPDGIPNAQNIPVSTLHTNIWYHLGLAYYLKNDLSNALRVYRKGIEASSNDDMLVATTHWLYMTLRLLGNEKKADEALEPIHKELNVIENMAYHNLCLFYKGEISLDELTGAEFSSIMNDALAYGIGNWYFCNNERGKAKDVFQKILGKDGWASFGYIAAEADWAREFKE